MAMMRMARGWVGVGALGLAGLVGCGHTGPPVGPQSAAAMAPASGAVADVREIHVNQDCVILQDRVDGVAGVSVPGGQAAPVGAGRTDEESGVQVEMAGQRDPAVCHLESQFTSNHVKGAVVNGAVQRSVVVVKEQEYLLQNEFKTPVVFVVEQAVPEGWTIDSDPKPDKVEGKVALFRVGAQAGQIVRVHVGEAHEIPLAQ